MPAGKHSTKGVGKTEPDSADYSEIEGVKVPFGQGVKKDVESDLLYNEYIVYDVAQVRIILYIKYIKAFKHRFSCVKRVIKNKNLFSFQIQAKYLFQLKFDYAT